MRGRAFFFSALLTSCAIVACSGSAGTGILDTVGDAAADARAGGGNGGEGGASGDSGGAGGGNDGGGPGGGDSGMGGGACVIPPGGPDGDGGTTCNGVLIGGAPVTTTCHMGSAPTPTGGTIVDGKYVLEQLDYYGDPGQCPTGPERIVWQICGSSWGTIQEHDLRTDYYSATATISAADPTQLNLEVSCPSTTTKVMDGYIATPTSLTLFITFGTNATRLDRFKKL